MWDEKEGRSLRQSIVDQTLLEVCIPQFGRFGHYYFHFHPSSMS
jgi:hypothetical protein